MRNFGKHIVLLTLSAFAIAGCGGGSEDESPNNVTDNLPPVIAGSPTTSITAGTPYNFQPQASDPNGDSLRFNAVNLPAWAAIDPTTGMVSGTPTESHVGMSGMITVEVTDQRAVAQLPQFQIQVRSATAPPPPPNTAPTISGTPATMATVGTTYTFTPVGDDADDDVLTYTIQNRPSWATFTPATGRLSGTPTTADIGTTTGIVITVHDDESSTSLPAFNLAVQAAPTTPPANRPPTITGTPGASVTVGQTYSFTPVGSDPDGNTLTYSATGLPSWLTLTTTTGRIRGTPTAANVGRTGNIVISVTDGTATVALPSFTILVNALPANRPPVISGSPLLSLNVLTAYSFTPTASDPDGDPLTFSISGRPGWATFSTTTGRLSGTPALTDIASFPNIIISVSDGRGATTSLPAFSINVLQVSLGSATVSWNAPTTNTDGSALTNLSGYRLAYGTSQTNLNQSIDINNVGTQTYTVTGLAVGTWYFGVQAINSTGTASAMSNVGSKTFQ